MTTQSGNAIEIEFISGLVCVHGFLDEPQNVQQVSMDIGVSQMDCYHTSKFCLHSSPEQGDPLGCPTVGKGQKIEKLSNNFASLDLFVVMHK